MGSVQLSHYAGTANGVRHGKWGQVLPFASYDFTSRLTRDTESCAATAIAEIDSADPVPLGSDSKSCEDVRSGSTRTAAGALCHSQPSRRQHLLKRRSTHKFSRRHKPASNPGG